MHLVADLTVNNVPMRFERSHRRGNYRDVQVLFLDDGFQETLTEWSRPVWIASFYVLTADISVLH